MRRRRLGFVVAVSVSAGLGLVGSGAAATSSIQGSVGNFSFGQLQGQTVGATGCGTNNDGEPAIRVSPSDLVVLGSERGVGGGSDAWRGFASQVRSSADPGCGLEYRGQPNAVAGAGASGGDIDIATGSATASTGDFPIYVSSLNLGSVSVAHSTDNGTTFTNVPVQGGLPLDDREWIAAFGANSSLLTFHDIATTNIDVLRSDNGGTGYVEISQAIPATNYKASNNEIGNIAIDRDNLAGTTSGTAGAAGFWAYQSFVAPSSAPGVTNLNPSFNEAFVAVSNNGGYTWTDEPVRCSTSSTGLNHQFPNVSVDPAGNVWLAWSDDSNVFTAVSSDHGASWICSGKVSTNTAQAVFPWIAATSGGAALVFYGSTQAPCTGSSCQQPWFVYYDQNPYTATSGVTPPTSWGTPQQLMEVHQGSVCEQGATCTTGRQLFDDFGVAVDQEGFSHIAYSHDAPDLGGSGTFTGYAAQVSGTALGHPN